MRARDGARRPTVTAASIDTCVCVPARDEGERLPRLLDALAAQRGVDPESWAACVFLDGAADDSWGMLEAFAARSPFAVHVEGAVAYPDPSAGRARRAAMALGLQRLTDPERGLLLTTDADSAPSPDWIAAGRRALAAADVATGRIVRPGAPTDDVQARLERYYDRLYALRRTLDPVPWETEPRHHYTGGANLGVRASAYLALGGFSERPAGEDALLIDEASRAGLRVRRDGRMVVATSSRRFGRAPGGLAAGLRAIDAQGEAAVSVAHPADAAWQYRGHAAARAAFPELGNAAVRAGLAPQLGLSPKRLGAIAAASPNAEAFTARVAPARPGGVRMVCLAEAEAALTELERAESRKAA